MKALLIIGIIILVFAVLLSFSATLYVSITDVVRMKAGAFGLRFDIRSPERDAKLALKETERLEKKEERALKKKKRKKKKAKNGRTPAKEGHPKKEEAFSDTVFLILNIIKSIFEPSKFVLRHTRLTGLCFDMSVGTDSADKTALTYAGIGIAVNNTLALLKSQIKVTVKRFSLRPDFTAEHITQDIRFKVKVRLGVIIAGGLGMLINMIKNVFIHTKEEQTPENGLRRESAEAER